MELSVDASVPTQFDLTASKVEVQGFADAILVVVQARM